MNDKARGDSGVAGTARRVVGGVPAEAATPAHCVGESGESGERRGGGLGVAGEVGEGAALGASMYRRSGSGQRGRSWCGTRGVAGMYGLCRRTMPSTCVSLRAGGPACRDPQHDATADDVASCTRVPH